MRHGVQVLKTLFVQNTFFFPPIFPGLLLLEKNSVDYTGKPPLNLSNSVIQRGSMAHFYREAH